MIDLEEIGRRAVALRVARVAVHAASDCEIYIPPETDVGFFGEGPCKFEPVIDHDDWCDRCIKREKALKERNLVSARLSGAITCYLKRTGEDG